MTIYSHNDQHRTIVAFETVDSDLLLLRITEGALAAEIRLSRTEAGRCAQALAGWAHQTDPIEAIAELRRIKVHGPSVNNVRDLLLMAVTELITNAVTDQECPSWRNVASDIGGLADALVTAARTKEDTL